VIVDEGRHLERLAAEPGARVSYRDDAVAVVVRTSR
jgi:hypothetical protein